MALGLPDEANKAAAVLGADRHQIFGAELMKLVHLRVVHVVIDRTVNHNMAGLPGLSEFMWCLCNTQFHNRIYIIFTSKKMSIITT